MMLILNTVNEVKKHILVDSNLSIPVPSKVSKNIFGSSQKLMFFQRELYELQSSRTITYANCVLYRARNNTLGSTQGQVRQ